MGRTAGAHDQLVTGAADWYRGARASGAHRVPRRADRRAEVCLPPGGAELAPRQHRRC